MTHPFVNVAKELAPGFEKRAAEWDKSRAYCWQNVGELADAGIMGMTIPKEVWRARREFSGCGLGGGRDRESLHPDGPHRCRRQHGRHQRGNGLRQRRSKGFLCANMCWQGTSPRSASQNLDAGSAATDMQTTARKQGNKYILNGTKHWITGGGVSKLHSGVSRACLMRRAVEQGIGGFILFADPISGNMPKGFSCDLAANYTMGLCGMPEAELRFENVEIDQKWLVKPPSGLKHGFAELMNAYNSQRVGAGTIAMGVAAGALERAKSYLLQREQFGRPLAEFQGLAMDARRYGHASSCSATASSRSGAITWSERQSVSRYDDGRSRQAFCLRDGDQGGQ